MVNITIDTGTTELLCHIEDHVGVITLNKPEKKNALGDILTPALRRELLSLEAKHLIDSAGTAESKEAISAFMQKRQPEFRNSSE